MKSLARITGITFLLLGAVLLFGGRSYIVPAFSTPVDIMDTGMQDIGHNTAVETDLPVIFERFASLDNMNYHVIPVWAGNEIKYIPLAVFGSQAGKYKKVIDNSMDWLDGDTDKYGTKTVSFAGVILKTDDEVNNRMKKWFMKKGLFEHESDIDNYTLPYMLYQVNLSGVRNNTIVFTAMIVIGIFLLLIGIFAYSPVYVPLELKETKINGVTYRLEQLDALNNLIMKGNKQQACDILIRKYHVEAGYAAFVTENWSEYYY